ncbi:hypothetical protein NA57DRAFT_60485 [Rhizodiscina lignyota]|uniref:Uncharacterized protein n=1 Tax=Rhizodiscina lignyota TaxID=1504668 RepID=A0A9P4I9E8_9PEZI|nr:hypothetical protein NA57DRAFT_60485 [Rhizodiscina lignyota]
MSTRDSRLAGLIERCHEHALNHNPDTFSTPVQTKILNSDLKESHVVQPELSERKELWDTQQLVTLYEVEQIVDDRVDAALARAVRQLSEIRARPQGPRRSRDPRHPDDRVEDLLDDTVRRLSEIQNRTSARRSRSPRRSGSHRRIPYERVTLYPI